MCITINDIENNVFYNKDKKLFIELLDLVEKHPNGYFTLIRKMPKLLEFVQQCTPLLNDIKYKISTKCNWIFHNIQEFPVCAGHNINGCNHVFNGNITVNKDYPRFCIKCNNTINSENIEKRSRTRQKHTIEDPNFLKNIIKTGWLIDGRNHDSRTRYCGFSGPR